MQVTDLDMYSEGRLDDVLQCGLEFVEKFGRRMIDIAEETDGIGSNDFVVRTVVAASFELMEGYAKEFILATVLGWLF